MRRSPLAAFVLTSLLIAFPAVLSVLGQPAAEPLSPSLKTWLEDVSPILTKTEREVFSKLRTNGDRERFVRFFWKARDPRPDTAENEFQKEYEERVRFADEAFGRDSPKRGSQTDRGFFYLLLGPPLERRFFTTHSEVWPLELWFYRGEEEYGLPPYFYLIFYQPEGIGEYRLYSPGVEGPEKLAMPLLTGRTVNRSTAVQLIKRVSSELAAAAQSYIPGEQALGSASLSSDLLIASVRNLPQKKYTDSYARSYLAYKDHIETEYSDRFLQSSFLVKVFTCGGQPFLHWTIEPERMGFAERGTSVSAAFELVLRLEDPQGRTVFERSEEIPLEISPAQYRAHERQRFAFQDVLAVVPGRHRALFLLKNKTAKDFSSFETGLTVPAPSDEGLSAPLLFLAREDLPEAQARGLKAFAFGGTQLVVGARNEFPPTGTLGVFVQGWGLGKAGEAGPSFTVDIVSLETGRSAASFPLTDVRQDADGATLLASGTYPLKDIGPGYYRAEVSAVSPEGSRRHTAAESFVVLSQPVPIVPWVYARLHGRFPGPEHFKVIGAQYFLMGAYGPAREALEKALTGRDDPSARLLLAQSLYGLGEFRESLAQALPLVEGPLGRDAAKVVALDYAGLKEWAAALPYLEKLMSEATEVAVLNLAAECHMALGRPDRALPLLQRSLALVPDQPSVRALEEQARKRVERK